MPTKLTKTPTPTKAPPTATKGPTPKPRNCAAKCIVTGGVGLGPVKCLQATVKPFKPCKEGNRTLEYPDDCGFYVNKFGNFPDPMNCYPTLLANGKTYYPKWCSDALGFYPLANGTYPSCLK
eukprot:EC124158.1.p1 GENE.EC124158.1~~EC124158.1.p1  ORF type:complete len:122 (+),score=16.48 EC124158.1:79-444(+)